MIFSCKGCEERKPGCHGSCEKYKREKAEYEERKAVFDKKRRVSDGITAQLYGSTLKAVKKRGRNGGGFCDQ